MLHDTVLHIRKAEKSDSVDISRLIMLAMQDIVYAFIGVKSESKATTFIQELVETEENQYSYENCWVVEVNNKVIASAVLYDGANLSQLQKKVAKKIKDEFSVDFKPEAETQDGEFYLDGIAVNPLFHGKGIGSRLIHFLNEHIAQKNKKNLGFLVEKENLVAKKLYSNLGFKYIQEKMLAGFPMEHLQIINKI